jgi:hypothetical protein
MMVRIVDPVFQCKNWQGLNTLTWGIFSGLFMDVQNFLENCYYYNCSDVLLKNLCLIVGTSLKMG